MAHARPLLHAVTGEPLMPATWTVKGESFGPDVPNGADRLMARGADQTGILRGHWSASDVSKRAVFLGGAVRVYC